MPEIATRGEFVVVDYKIYNDMTPVELMDVILNRVSIINQILGCKYDYAWNNPLVVSSRKGRVTVEISHAIFSAGRNSDAEGLRHMLENLDVLKSALWLMTRGGMKISSIQ